MLGQQPKTWEEVLKLMQDETKLRQILRARLVFLALNEDGAVAPRAVEMVLDMRGEGGGDDLGDVPTSVLEQAHAKALDLIQSLNAREGRENEF